MLSISTELSSYYSIACIIIGLGYAYLLYAKESIINSKWLKNTLFFIRAIVVSFICFLLLNPLLNSLERTTEKPIVILVQDVSASITEHTQTILEELQTQLSDFMVYSYHFSDELAEGLLDKNSGLTTDYSALLEALNTRFVNRNVAAVVLATDGLYNKGMNPMYSPHLPNFPIYPIALGDTAVQQDVAITKVKHNKLAFLGNSFAVEVLLSAQQVAGKQLLVSIRKEGKKIAEQKIEATTKDFFAKLEFQLAASDYGLQEYNVHVSKVNGEQNIHNNHYVFYVDVIDAQYKILLLQEGVHPDVAAYLSALEHNMHYATTKMNAAEFDGNLDDYQLLVLFGWDENNTQLLQKIEQAKVPLLVFGKGGTKSIHPALKGFSFKPRKGMEQINAIWNDDFDQFSISPELKVFVEEVPPLTAPLGSVTLHPSSTAILYQKIDNINTDNPIILISQNSNRKVAYIAAEGFWQWKLYDYKINKSNVIFEELFAKLSQYLVLDEDKSKFRMQYQKEVVEGNEVVFEAELYNDSYQLITNKDIKLTITDKDRKRYDYLFSSDNNHYVLNSGVFAVGKYHFEAQVQGTNQIKKGIFNVQPLQLEQISTVANHNLLHQMANKSGGKLFFPTQIEALFHTIKESNENQSVIHTEEKLQGLINIPMILLSLLVLLSLEWFIRKFNGLI